MSFQEDGPFSLTPSEILNLDKTLAKYKELLRWSQDLGTGREEEYRRKLKKAALLKLEKDFHNQFINDQAFKIP